MSYLKRKIDLSEQLQKKSVLLLGPRRTGKSSLIRNEFKSAKVYNLLKSDEFQRLSMRPSLIRESLEVEQPDLVVIDEIQKLPSLMDEVHLMIEEYGQRFLLTGSSARKLKRTHTSLMAGRAKTCYLHPFVSSEIGEFNLIKVLLYGLLPPVFLSDDPEGELASYVGDYLQEEIKAEALSRNIENFSRFLSRAALSNAALINFESIANDAAVPSRTVREYYTVLEDTLIGRLLHPLESAGHRKVVSKGKFYFFDTGVVHFLQGMKSLPEMSAQFGDAFETFIFHELRSYLDYTTKRVPLNFWRTHSGIEVDFVIDGRIAIEVKATKTADKRDIVGLNKLAEDRKVDKRYLVTRDPERRKLGNVEVWPYGDFIKALWNGHIL